MIGFAFMEGTAVLPTCWNSLAAGAQDPLQAGNRILRFRFPLLLVGDHPYGPRFNPIMLGLHPLI